VTARLAPSIAPSAVFGRDGDRVTPVGSLLTEVRRRAAGRYTRDGFGLDPQVSDLLAPVLSAIVRVEVDGADQIGAGPATLVMNRGLGVVEPAALAVAVARDVGRRVRVVGAPDVVGIGGALRRIGGIGSSPAEIAAALAAGHLVVLPLALTWLRAGAGTPPLELVQSITGTPVHPVAVRPGGPFGLAIRPWRVTIGAALEHDMSYPPGDPLAAADVAEAARAAVDALLRGPSSG